MALYAIGDVQGCRGCLEKLLARIDYQPDKDRLWLVGDLVNRGPDSAGVLRLARELDVTAVLGNHDLHLLAVAAGVRGIKGSDTFQDVLTAPDRSELLSWLGRLPLLVRDDPAGWVMVHAGLPPAWDVAKATTLARETESLLRRHGDEAWFLQEMYGDDPAQWRDDLQGMDRARYVVNALTRLRFCDADSRLALDFSGPPGSQPPEHSPWFELWSATSHRIVFGHWAQLGAGDHGHAVSTDSGCVWGYRLTAAELDSSPVSWFSVSCEPQ